MNIYDDPKYWCGDIGYRSPGYADFPINRVKEICVLIRRPKNVLDIGCAFGFTVSKLRSLGVEAYGVDVSKYAISQSPVAIRKHLFRESAADMHFWDKEFDLVYSSGVLEHLNRRDLDKAINEIVRVGNRGLIGVSCLDDPATHDGDDDTHEVILTKNDWQDLFPTEFEIVSDSTEEWMLLMQKELDPINKLLKEFTNAV